MNKKITFNKLATMVAFSGALQAQAQSTRPNVLLILTDEQSCWTISAYGKGPYSNHFIETPNIDALAAEGALMTNHIANAAVSTPSRGQLLTGRYCHQNGAYDNWMPMDQKEITLGQQLKDAGYETAYFGKWHLSGEDELNLSGPIFGFDNVKYFGINAKTIIEKEGKLSQNHNIPSDSSAYLTDYLTDKAIKYIKTERTKPFFCLLSIHDPHMPFSTREPYASMFNKDSIPLPVNYYDTFPSWGVYKISEKSYKKTVKQYLGMVKLIDDKVGEIIATLKKQGIYDNTIIIFTTDHGDYMGQHGLYSKNECYEEVYRVPFIIRYPAKVKSKVVVDKIVSNIHVMPTILDMVKVEPNKNIEGKSFLPLLQGKKMKWQSEAIQLKGNKSEGYFNKYAGYLTDNYHLMLKNVNGGKDNLLFDRKNDPFEQHNLYNNPTYRKTSNELTKKILLHYKQYHLEGQDWLESLQRK